MLQVLLSLVGSSQQEFTHNAHEVLLGQRGAIGAILYKLLPVEVNTNLFPFVPHPGQKVGNFLRASFRR